MATRGRVAGNCGVIYVDEMNQMQDAATDNNTSKLSMRRTLLTLLGALGAFGVLTASYATAELPNGSMQPLAPVSSTVDAR